MSIINITVLICMHNDIQCKVCSFEIPGGVTTPEEFASAVDLIEPQLTGSLPVLLTGRGPVWGFAMLAHAAHACPAVATFDPRLGYVVVQSHSPGFKVGEVLAVEGLS